MLNPRYPYSLRAFRTGTNQDGSAMTDAEGVPAEEALTVRRVAVGSDGYPAWRPLADGEDAPEGSVAVELDGGRWAAAYEDGESVPFGYRTMTRYSAFNSESMSCDYRISTPLLLTPLEVGDALELTDLSGTHRARVVKAQGFFSFGTVIWANEPRQ